MSAASLKVEIDALRAIVAPLLDRIEELQRRHDDALSLERIAMSGVTHADVFTQHAGDSASRAAALAAHAGKPWVAWNGRVYSTLDALSGRFSPRSALGYVRHVPA